MAISLEPFASEIKQAKTSYRIKRNLLDAIVTYYGVCADTNLGVSTSDTAAMRVCIPTSEHFSLWKATGNHIKGI